MSSIEVEGIVMVLIISPYFSSFLTSGYYAELHLEVLRLLRSIIGRSGGLLNIRFENFPDKKDLVLEFTISIKVNIQQFYTPINPSLEYIPKVKKYRMCYLTGKRSSRYSHF